MENKKLLSYKLDTQLGRYYYIVDFCPLTTWLSSKKVMDDNIKITRNAYFEPISKSNYTLASEFGWTGDSMDKLNISQIMKFEKYVKNDPDYLTIRFIEHPDFEDAKPISSKSICIRTYSIMDRLIIGILAEKLFEELPCESSCCSECSYEVQIGYSKESFNGLEVREDTIDEVFKGLKEIFEEFKEKVGL